MARRRGPVVGSLLVLTLLGACADGSTDSSSTQSESTASSSSSTKASGSSTSSTSAPTPDTTEVTIAAAGDLLPHSSVLESAAANTSGDGYDFSPMFANVKQDISRADLALCHLETTLSPDNTNLTQSRVLSFSSPHELADAIAGTGFDGCDFASNHTWDRGKDGVAKTRKVLTDAGVGYAGPTVKEGIDRRRATHEAGGAEVAHLAYTYTIFNSGGPTTDVPSEAPTMGKSLWPKVGTEGILADAGDAKEDGADFVVVSMHWGSEYVTEPTQRQQEMARELLESDAVDLILGTHVHVAQPCETINGKPVLYGLGNFLSNQSPEVAPSLRTETQEGMYATVTLTKDESGEVTSEVTYQPTRVNLDGHVIEKATPKQHPETYQRVVETMGSLGEGACEAEPAS